MPWFPSKKRSWTPGKGKGKGGPPKKKSLTATVSALAKMVKKDHKILNSNIDYADFYVDYAAAINWEQFSYFQFMNPVGWTTTCRRNTNTVNSPDAMLKSIELSFNIFNNLSLLYLHFFVALVRPRDVWVPDLVGPNRLRLDVDYTDMGPGNSPSLNPQMFKVLAVWHLNTQTAAAGMDNSLVFKARSKKITLNQLLRAKPTTALGVSQQWRDMNDSNFNQTEKLYLLTWCNTFQGTPLGPSLPSIGTTMKFTTNAL